MTTTLDDSRISDYLFNELGAKEKALFEKELAENPELAAAVEEFRALNGQLKISLGKEMKTFSLSENQRGDFRRATEADQNKPGFRFSFLGTLINRPGLSFVCALLVAGFCFVLVKDVVVVPELQQASRKMQPAKSPLVLADVTMDGLVEKERIAEEIPPDESSSLSYEVGGSLSPVATSPAPSPAAAPADLPVAGQLFASGRAGGKRIAASGGGYLGGENAVRSPAATVTSGATSAVTATRNIPANEIPEIYVQDGQQRNRLVAREFYYPGTVPGSGESYQTIVENPFKNVGDEPLSTFSIDVDTASYTNLRRFLNQGLLPPPNAVRIEEMLNYFTYDYPQPQEDLPFSVNMEVATCPWNPSHQLAHVGIQGRKVPASQRAPLNLVFLIDVSGSMSDENKLPLVKKGLALLVKNLNPTDRVALVTYAGNSRLALPSTPATQKNKILQALDNLESGGSTNGEGGIRRAYDVAREHFIRKGINRVILATDGDFNVGVSDRNELVGLIQAEARSGVYLNIFGFGMGNLKDATLEQLANKGNGIYGYIDSYQEARKVFADQVNSTLVTIAKDVKIQVEFNPAKVGAYRLIGYENRMLNKEDFNDDRKDAGEVGAGHSVTALYELIPPGEAMSDGRVDPLKYQRSAVTPSRLTSAAGSGEVMTLKLRYKEPAGGSSKLMKFALADSGYDWSEASDNLRFSASVAAFGMVLRNSAHRGNAGFEMIDDLAAGALGYDPEGYRREFVRLVHSAEGLKKEQMR